MALKIDNTQNSILFGSTEIKETSSGQITISGGTFTFPNTGLKAQDTDASNTLTLKPGSNLSNDRVLTITTGDSDRNLTLAGDATISGTHSGTSSGTNTGDQTSVSGNAGTATALQTARSIYGNNFDGTADLTQIIASTYGGTGNGFTKFSGPTTAEKTFTLPNASATILTDNAAVTVAQGGTGVASFTAYAVVCGGTTASGALQNVSGLGTAGYVLTSNGAGTLPTWQAVSAGATAYRYSTTSGTDPVGTGTDSLIIGKGATAEDANNVVVIGKDASVDNGTGGAAGGVENAVVIGNGARIIGASGSAAAFGAIAIGSAGGSPFNCDINASGTGNVDGRQIAIGANAQIYSSGTGNVGGVIAIGGAAYVESTTTRSDNSIAISANCTISNSRDTVLIGNGSSAIGTSFSVLMGTNLYITPTSTDYGYHTVIGGVGHSITGTKNYNNTILGGDTNVIVGDTSKENDSNVIIGGYAHTMDFTGASDSCQHNFMGGGTSSTIDANGTTSTSVNSAAIFGNGHTIDGYAGVAYLESPLVTGYNARPIVNASHTIGAGSFSTTGDAQLGTVGLKVQTTDATQTEIYAVNGFNIPSGYLTLPNNTTLAFDALIVARRTDADGENAAYVLRGVIKRDGNAASTALVGTIDKTVLAEDTSAWDVTAVADTTNGRLAIKVTGQGSKTIQWVANVRFTMTTG